MKHLTPFVFAGLAAFALASCTTTGERASGAGVGVVTGAVVAGPIGAVVGGVAGAVAGPSVAQASGVPHSHYRRHRRHHPG